MKNDFIFDIWYFAGLRSDFKRGSMQRVEIAGEPINIGRRDDGRYFALRDICPHRAAPLSAGCQKEGTVECPYHGWRFDLASGECRNIPALVSDQTLDTTKIKVRSYPIREDGHLVWVYIAKDKRFSEKPDINPPEFPLAARKPVLDDRLDLNCFVDHAVIGLMDPAHGPYVHRQWWWRSEKSMHEKAKNFAPIERGFSMVAHSPSSNSFAYKILGGKPVTEINFQIPGIRTETIKVGAKTVLSFTAVTPIDLDRTRIRQIFFTDHIGFKCLAPFLGGFARQFLRQDADMVDLQQSGLKYDPGLMLIEDADTQAKWYYAIKKEWAESSKDKRTFKNPVTARVLRWRS